MPCRGPASISSRTSFLLSPRRRPGPEFAASARTINLGPGLRRDDNERAHRSPSRRTRRSPWRGTSRSLSRTSPLLSPRRRPGPKFAASARTTNLGPGLRRDDNERARRSPSRRTRRSSSRGTHRSLSRASPLLSPRRRPGPKFTASSRTSTFGSDLRAIDTLEKHVVPKPCGQHRHIERIECAVLARSTRPPDRSTNPRAVIPTSRTPLSFPQALVSQRPDAVVHRVTTSLSINVLEV